MLTAQRDAGLLITCDNDAVDEARKWGNAANKEGGNCAPIASEFGRVAVDTVEVVHVGYGHITASDNVVTAARDKQVSGHGRGRWGAKRATNSVIRMDVMGPKKMV
jgi:hypothetical protein